MLGGHLKPVYLRPVNEDGRINEKYPSAMHIIIMSLSIVMMTVTPSKDKIIML